MSRARVEGDVTSSILTNAKGLSVNQEIIEFNTWLLLNFYGTPVHLTNIL